jgi:hypothetical protein
MKDERNAPLHHFAFQPGIHRSAFALLTARQQKDQFAARNLAVDPCAGEDRILMARQKSFLVFTKAGRRMTFQREDRSFDRATMARQVLNRRSFRILVTGV